MPQGVSANTLQEAAVEEYLSGSDSKDAAKLRDLSGKQLICCPEDQSCEAKCERHARLCLRCKFPVCSSCMLQLQSKQTVPVSLGNDNWYGTLQKWIYDVGVTWMEKTSASPYWTGMTLFIAKKQRGQRRHLMHNPLYQATQRVAFKGQVFSAPMDWSSMIEQLQQMEKKDALIALPHVGAVLASKVRIQISSGLVS